MVWDAGTPAELISRRYDVLKQLENIYWILHVYENVLNEHHKTIENLFSGLRAPRVLTSQAACMFNSD